VLVAAIVVAHGTAKAQDAPAKWADTISGELKKANLSGDIAAYTSARALAERVATAYPSDGLILHYAGFALYQEASMIIGRGGNATPLLNRAQDYFTRSLKTHPLAETHALMASIDGQLIGADPSRAMELGIASQEENTAAVAMAPKNPRVWLIRGIGWIFTPEEYGGGLAKAKDDIQHAIDLFATDAPKPGEPSWGHAEAYVWLGQVYEKLHDKTKAEAAYKSALALAPTFAWPRTLLAALK